MFLPVYVDLEEEPRQRHPWLVWGLLVAIIVVYFALALHVSDARRMDLWWRFGVSRFNVQIWQALTCTFLHGGLMHLFGNAFMLWIYGSSLEKLLGWWRFLVIYLIGAYGSMAVHLLTTPAHRIDEPAIGASGAIAAVFGAFLILMPRAKLTCLFFSVISFRPILVRVPAWVILGMWFVGQILWTLGVIGQMEGIAFWAHVAGFVTGAVIGSIFKARRQGQMERWIAQVREPYRSAWQAWLNGDPSAARRRWEPVSHETFPEAAGGAALLDALLQLQFPDDETEGSGMESLQKAFIRARDYQDSAKALTCYLQMLQVAAPEHVPARFHRDAAAAALSLQQPQVALFGFHQALKLGHYDRLEQIARGLCGIYRGQGRPELTAEIAAWLPDGGQDFLDAPPESEPGTP